MAKKEKEWPLFDLPKQREEITVANVLAVIAGEKREEMIREWCVSVWKT